MDCVDWTNIDTAARALGVREEALKKWHQRGSVPHKWRLAIIRQTGGLISIDAFGDVPSPVAETTA